MKIAALAFVSTVAAGGCITIEDSNTSFGNLMATKHTLNYAEVYAAVEPWAAKNHHAINDDEWMWLGWEMGAITKGANFNANTWNDYLNIAREHFKLPCPSTPFE